MDQNISKIFSFSIIVFSMKLLVILFIRKKKHLLGNNFGSLYTSNQIYLLQICFLNYVYLKDMHITLKGIGKILFEKVNFSLITLNSYYHSKLHSNKQ